MKHLLTLLTVVVFASPYCAGQNCPEAKPFKTVGEKTQVCALVKKISDLEQLLNGTVQDKEKPSVQLLTLQNGVNKMGGVFFVVVWKPGSTPAVLLAPNSSVTLQGSGGACGLTLSNATMSGNLQNDCGNQVEAAIVYHK